MHFETWGTASPASDGHADIVLRGADSSVLARVELRNLPRLTPDDAAALRGNLLIQRATSDDAYFLLLSQDRGYLWAPALHMQPGASADVIFPMVPVVKRFVPDFDGRRRLTHGELRLVAIGWLYQLLDEVEAPTQEPERALAAAGFLAAIQRGRVTLDLAH